VAHDVVHIPGQPGLAGAQLGNFSLPLDLLLSQGGMILGEQLQAPRATSLEDRAHRRPEHPRRPEKDQGEPQRDED